MTPLDVSRPLRLCVDLSRPPGVPRARGPSWFEASDRARGVEAILGSGALFLQLGYPPQRRGESLAEFIGRAAGRGFTVSVVLEGRDASPRESAAAGAREVSLDLTGARGDDSVLGRRLGGFLRERDQLPGKPFRAGASFRFACGEAGRLREFLRACDATRPDFIELPPPALVYYDPRDRGKVVIRPGDYRLAAEILREMSGVLAAVGDLRIHDILLWSVVRRLPSFRDLQGDTFRGCQAAGTLGFVSGEGVVYPCQVIGSPLGRVEELAGEEFWQRTAAAAVRAAVARCAAACAGCGFFDPCGGGCPGARAASSGSWEGLDPLCEAFGELPG